MKNPVLAESVANITRAFEAAENEMSRLGSLAAQSKALEDRVGAQQQNLADLGRQITELHAQHAAALERVRVAEQRAQEITAGAERQKLTVLDSARREAAQIQTKATAVADMARKAFEAVGKQFAGG